MPEQLYPFGWAGPEACKRAWDEIGHLFPKFKIQGKTEVKRICAWDSWQDPLVGFNINTSTLVRQIRGSCVSFGAAIALAGTAAHEIVRLGEFEKFHVPYPPYLYGISRVMPEGGNGRLRGSDGSLGSWMAETIKLYGVLREDFKGVPQYSGNIELSWGNSKSPWEQFIDEADNHLLKTAARITSVEALSEAVSNGYFCTIASMKGYAMRLRDENGKSWYVGRDTWPHQMSIIAQDIEPDLCFYRRNQWGKDAHGPQLDGPDGGGWVHAEELDRELRDSGTECYAFSQFDGFPSEENKPRNYFADPAPGETNG